MEHECIRCRGCGRIANSDDAEPWSHWEALAPGSDLAVTTAQWNYLKQDVMATQEIFTALIECPDCGGSGKLEA